MSVVVVVLRKKVVLEVKVEIVLDPEAEVK